MGGARVTFTPRVPRDVALVTGSKFSNTHSLVLQNSSFHEVGGSGELKLQTIIQTKRGLAGSVGNPPSDIKMVSEEMKE